MYGNRVKFSNAFSACVQFSAFGNRIQFPHSVIKRVLPALIVGGFLIALIVDWNNLMPNKKFLLYMQISRKYIFRSVMIKL